MLSLDKAEWEKKSKGNEREGDGKAEGMKIRRKQGWKGEEKGRLEKEKW